MLHNTPPTALGMAIKFKSDLRAKIVSIGSPTHFRDYFIAAFYDELPNEELTEEKITAAITYLLNS